MLLLDPQIRCSQEHAGYVLKYAKLAVDSRFIYVSTDEHPFALLNHYLLISTFLHLCNYCTVHFLVIISTFTFCCYCIRILLLLYSHFAAATSQSLLTIAELWRTDWLTRGMQGWRTTLVATKTTSWSSYIDNDGESIMYVCMCVTGACKQNSSFVFHPISIKLSEYLYYPSKTNPIENRHGWVILGCSGRCERRNFTEFRLVNRTAPSFFIRFR